MLTSADVKTFAREAGFDLCGVAPAEAFPELTAATSAAQRGGRARQQRGTAASAATAPSRRRTRPRQPNTCEARGLRASATRGRVDSDG